MAVPLSNISGALDVLMERRLALAPEVLLCCSVGLIGGFVFGLLHVSTEHFWFFLLRALEAHGLVTRIAPSITITRVHANMETLLSVSIANMPLVAIMFAGRTAFWKNCHMSLDLAGGLLFTVVVMVLNDAYFWFVHTNLHHFKKVYRAIHQLHHSTSGDITVFSTSYGEILDVVFEFTPFYLMLISWLYCKGQWNPLHIVLAAFVANNFAILGHCGYHLPPWVLAPASLGVAFIPLAQVPKHHYIHHLDPRFNRSLYFTWCDRIAGTFRDTHPICILD